MKKSISAIVAMMILGASAVFAMGGQDGASDDITVISRESGSGTRGAFVELFGIEKKNSAGKKIDYTVTSADISNSTEVVIQSVSGNKSAIGYISLGSLNDSVKALKIDGATASVASIKNGSYKISRPFNIVTKTSNNNELVADFIRFILSKEGQAIVESRGYIAAASNPSYIPTGKKGKITIAGSSSVFPVMEKLSEGYKKLNPNMVVEVSQSDSGTGITSATQGVCDIGMASRDLKSSETEKGIISTKIAIDGVAVIVNKANPINDITKDNVQKIYTGETILWSNVK
jgi:phosphate transport system substrate-binding protein